MCYFNYSLETRELHKISFMKCFIMWSFLCKKFVTKTNTKQTFHSISGWCDSFPKLTIEKKIHRIFVPFYSYSDVVWWIIKQRIISVYVLITPQSYNQIQHSCIETKENYSNFVYAWFHLNLGFSFSQIKYVGIMWDLLLHLIMQTWQFKAIIALSLCMNHSAYANTYSARIFFFKQKNALLFTSIRLSLCTKKTAQSTSLHAPHGIKRH